MSLDLKIFKLIQEIKKIKNPEFCEKLLKLVKDYDEHHYPPEELIKPSPFLQLFHSREHVAILNLASEFQNVNPAYAKVVGYPQYESLLGLSYENFKGDAVEHTHYFKQQDQTVIATHKPLEFLSYHRYADGNWHLLWGEKNIILDETHQAVGVYSRAKDMTQHPLIDMSRFLMREAQEQFGRFRQQSFIYYIDRDYQEFQMTPKEKEVLFYLLRGKTVLDIANLLCRSKRTVDMHVESLKQKFNVGSKALLIEKAILYGYMNFIPKTFFRSFHA
jgi:DNA-binding CsgD family transcriptional regulator